VRQYGNSLVAIDRTRSEYTLTLSSVSISNVNVKNIYRRRRMSRVRIRGAEFELEAWLKTTVAKQGSSENDLLSHYIIM